MYVNLPWLLYLCFLCPFPRGILCLLEETEFIKGRVSLSSLSLESPFIV